MGFCFHRFDLTDEPNITTGLMANMWPIFISCDTSIMRKLNVQRLCEKELKYFKTVIYRRHFLLCKKPPPPKEDWKTGWFQYFLKHLFQTTPIWSFESFANTINEGMLFEHASQGLRNLLSMQKKSIETGLRRTTQPFHYEVTVFTHPLLCGPATIQTCTSTWGEV